MTNRTSIDGTISEISYRMRKLTVYTPKEYVDDQNKAFPVVLVQDDDFLFKDSLVEIEENVKKGLTAPVVLVGIHSELRNDEYTPWPREALVGNLSFAGEGDAYLDTLENEIIPFIQSHYRLSTDPYDWALGGASLGGLISIYAMYKKSNLFKKFMLISSSLWYEGMLEFMRSEQLDSSLQIYMYVGEKEGILKSNAQQYMVANNKIGYDILCQKLHSPAEQIRFETDAEGVHDDHYFIPYFLRGLPTLFPALR